MGVYRVSVGVLFAGAGSPGANVWHVRTMADGGIGPLDLNGALTALWDFYGDITQLFHPSTVLSLEDVVRIDGSEPEDADHDPKPDLAGTGSGGELPPRLALCCSWRTSTRTRSGRGRTFIGPLTGAVLDADGTPSNAYTADLRAAAQALVNAGATTGNGWAFGVWSRQESVLRDFTGVSVSDGRWAALRSRED